MSSHTILFALAVLSGLAFSCVGIGYRAGHMHRIAVTQVALAICIAGAAFFAAASHGTPMTSVPPVIWGVALLAGTGQFIALKLIGQAFLLGPLSPVWCAVNLNFVVTIAYTRLFLGEPIRTFGYIGGIVAIACVVVAAWGQGEHTNDPEQNISPQARFLYGSLLFCILLTNSLWITGIKYFSLRLLADGQSYLDRYGNQFGLGVYLMLGLLVLGEMVLRRHGISSIKAWMTTGAFAAAGSIVGFWALNNCAVLPASVVLPINSVTSLLGAALVSVWVFREHRTSWWYATVGLAVTAVVLVNIP